MIFCIIILLIVPYLTAAEWTNPVSLNHVADTIQKQRSSSMNDFEIFHDSSSNTWHVVGVGIQRFVQMTNWQYVFSSFTPIICSISIVAILAILSIIVPIIFCIRINSFRSL